jgi:opacity protein-like surface antigen
MNIKLLKQASLIVGMCCAVSAFAAEHGSKSKNEFYIKPEVGYSNFQLSNKLNKSFEGNDRVNLNKLKNAFTSSVPTAGLTVGKHFGNLDVELGYSMLRTTNKKLTLNNNLANDAMQLDVQNVEEYISIGNEINNINLDAKYNINLGTKFKLLPAVGVGHMHSKASFKNSVNNADNKTIEDLKKFAKKNANELQPRAGLGVNYDIAKNFSVSANANYQIGNNIYKGVTSVKAGVELGF